MKKQISFAHSYRSIFLWFVATYLILKYILPAIVSLSLAGVIPLDADEYTINSLILKFNFIFVMFLYMYLFYLVFYKFYPHKKLFLVIGLAAALMAPIFVRYFLDQMLYYWVFGTTNYNVELSFHFFYSDNIHFAKSYILSGILYYFFRRNQVLQQARIEDAKLQAQAEVSHLRSQVNPHFLFNSLNNIYSLAYDKSDKILGAIEGLSELLRYALYEKSEFVTFKTEWIKIQQLIVIEQIRLVKPVEFDIDISENVMEILIPPVMLFPLIENVFKHGEVQDPKNPPTIKAYVKDEHLMFKIENKISKTEQKDSQKGIGLENIKKRLMHVYNTEASFEVLEKEDTFTAQLSIPIK